MFKLIFTYQSAHDWSNEKGLVFPGIPRMASSLKKRAHNRVTKNSEASTDIRTLSFTVKYLNNKSDKKITELLILL